MDQLRYCWPVRPDCSSYLHPRAPLLHRGTRKAPSVMGHGSHVNHSHSLMVVWGLDEPSNLETLMPNPFFLPPALTKQRPSLAAQGQVLVFRSLGECRGATFTLSGEIQPVWPLGHAVPPHSPVLRGPFQARYRRCRGLSPAQL